MNIEVNGPKILFQIPILGGINITETTRNAWIIMVLIIGVSIFLTRNLSVRNPSRRQIIAEKLVTTANNWVESTMGVRYRSFAPYIGALFISSLCGSLSSVTGARPFTGDLSTTLAWALVTTVMVQVNNIRANGVLGWLKSFTKPVFVMTPINLVSEIATPISLSFRHFGNIGSGIVITTLIYAALSAASHALLGWIPNDFIANIPILQIGIPAFLSLYFDVFTSFLQAFIISMLTMVFVSNAGE
ncbi:MAG: F0F1 ATP synthase subunit A [Clostridia bacterium]|nr:F0F1 ATP synthase subunit A [Clostridia bacterium]